MTDPHPPSEVLKVRLRRCPQRYERRRRLSALAGNLRQRVVESGTAGAMQGAEEFAANAPAVTVHQHLLAVTHLAPDEGLVLSLVVRHAASDGGEPPDLERDPSVRDRTVGVSRNARPAASRHAGDMGLRCLIVDDSAPFLKAARELLEREGINVVGVASTSTEAIRRVEELRPDLVLVDIDLGPDSGFDLVRHIDRNASDLVDSKPTIILISGHSEQDLEELIAASPAAGFLGKLSLSASAIRSLIWDNGSSEPEANAPREM